MRTVHWGRVKIESMFRLELRARSCTGKYTSATAIRTICSTKEAAANARHRGCEQRPQRDMGVRATCDEACTG